MKIAEHFLFKIVLAIVNWDRIVSSIKVMCFGDSRGFNEMTDISGCLTWLSPHHNEIFVNCAECINYHFTLNGLNWVQDNRH